MSIGHPFAVRIDKTKLHILNITNYIIIGIFFLSACAGPEEKAGNGAFADPSGDPALVYDFDQIQQGGELIAATLNGPDAYFEYQGRPMGLQYALIAHFAQQHGLRVRVEVGRDEGELLHLLQNGEVDVVCYPIARKTIAAAQLTAAGVKVDSLSTSWAVRPNAPLLQAALDTWYSSGIVVEVTARARQLWQHRRTVKRKVRAPYISKEKGILSIYDHHFKAAANAISWDWRLLAAICYQESGFDPLAESAVGAQGLMQLMPATAARMQLAPEKVFEPRENIAAGARYLKMLERNLNDIPSPTERLKFVLASYNGGLGHIRDAMTLAKKHRKNPQLWDEVAPFVLHLSDPRYYRDPDVQYGYMIGEETYQYVYSIWERWRQYGGKGAAMHLQWQSRPASEDSTAVPAHRRHRRNRFTRDTKIYQPSDPEFQDFVQP